MPKRGYSVGLKVACRPMSSPTEKPLDVFISYSHKDEALKEELEVHLSNLVRQNKIQPWQDRDIEGGTKWNQEIQQAMETADIILLLVSPRFMASSYIHEVELRHAIARDQQGTARVIPIILKPCDFQGTAIADLQALPKDAVPITKWADQDEAFVNVVRGLRRVIETWGRQRQANRQAATAQTPEARNGPTVAKSASNPDAAASDPQKRLALFQFLLSLPSAQFDPLVYALNVPPAEMPPPMAPHTQRVAKLLEWTEGSMGCGLPVLEARIDAVGQR